MTRGRSRGFSMIEVVIAAALSLLVLTGAGTAIAATQRAVNDGATRDRATATALSVLEQADALGCGLAVRPPTVTTALVDACTNAYGDLSDTPPTALDGTSTRTDTDDREYAVRVTTHWSQPGYEGQCIPELLPGAPAAARTRPALLVREVTVDWTANGLTNSQTYTAVEAVPATADFDRGDVGGIVVFAAEDTLATVKQNTTDEPLSRFTRACTGSATGTYAAWFPYLPPGGYLVGTDGQATVPVVVTAGAVAEVAL